MAEPVSTMIVRQPFVSRLPTTAAPILPHRPPGALTDGADTRRPAGPSPRTPRQPRPQGTRPAGQSPVRRPPGAGLSGRLARIAPAAIISATPVVSSARKRTVVTFRRWARAEEFHPG